MPVTTFNVIWPDDSTQACYSPSSVIRNYFKLNHHYTVNEFRNVCEVALNEASNRVAQKFGFACSSAMDQLRDIQQKCDAYEATNGTVTIASIHS
jgi:uncharacterized repeat protein (TIGR04042 family)